MFQEFRIQYLPTKMGREELIEIDFPELMEYLDLNAMK
jgi:hypothetical protein